MLSTLANTGDVLDDMWQGLCVITGLVVVPLTLVAWGWFIRQRRRGKGRRGKSLVIFATILAVFWGLLAYSARPPFPVGGTKAAYAVHNLPEVLAKGDKLSSMSESTPNSNAPYWQWGFGTISAEGKFELWHRFRVNAYDGRVQVAVDDAGEKWVPIEEWRRTESSRLQAPPKGGM